MRIWLFGLFIATLISGCSTIPSTPIPHPHAYSFQILEIDIPRSSARLGWNSVPANLSLTNRTIEALFNTPNVNLYEYPIIRAEIGSPVYLEQIKKVSFVKDFIVVDGKAQTQKEKCKLGTIITITLDEVDGNVASFSINLSTRNLKRYNTVNIEGEKIRLPVFFDKQLVTSMRHEFNSWMSLGGIQYTTRKKDEPFRKYFAIRIIPPSGQKDSPVSGKLP